MVEASDKIAQYLGRGRDAYDRDSAIRDAIVYQIVVLGEAAKTVVAADASIASEIADVEWSLLARMRDRVTHQYFGVDHEIVWSTAKNDVPRIKAALTNALERLTSS
jgi:uncharacterized protein with HEPN domain